MVVRSAVVVRILIASVALRNAVRCRRWSDDGRRWRWRWGRWRNRRCRRRRWRLRSDRRRRQWFGRGRTLCANRCQLSGVRRRSCSGGRACGQAEAECDACGCEGGHDNGEKSWSSIHGMSFRYLVSFELRPRIGPGLLPASDLRRRPTKSSSGSLIEPVKPPPGQRGGQEEALRDAMRFRPRLSASAGRPFDSKLSSRASAPRARCDRSPYNRDLLHGTSLTRCSSDGGSRPRAVRTRWQSITKQSPGQSVPRWSR